ncbi:MAG: hypothetical protein ACRD4F_15260, partial [Candidatus Angelobacter sp.]
RTPRCDLPAGPQQWQEQIPRPHNIDKPQAYSSVRPRDSTLLGVHCVQILDGNRTAADAAHAIGKTTAEPIPGYSHPPLDAAHAIGILAKSFTTARAIPNRAATCLLGLSSGGADPSAGSAWG